ncbi:MAG: hypothetical protein DI555_14120 [Novosphingobium pentaromativorans]|uniref:DUF3168 domain-containing protein n=1 Tax=Novosphingobium pentaromativorans TaxID=205844 RepID=A0A2W5NL58_9SPHN|nr:MAG: hypothetical protein DI555_14120 [Novosphingobium pentaromativorans]
MDGIVAVRSVLIDDEPLTELAPADDIAAGPRPMGFALPGISLASVSKVDRNIPAPGEWRHVRERVQATIHARNYPEQKAILRAMRKAAADRLYPEVPGIRDVTIHTEPAGPDFMIEAASIWCGTQDFIVTYSEPR